MKYHNDSYVMMTHLLYHMFLNILWEVGLDKGGTGIGKDSLMGH